MQGLLLVFLFGIFAVCSARVTRSPDDGPGTRDPMCPYPSDKLVYFPYPYDCSKYWECYQGHKYLMQCPNDLWWNQKASYCDFEENVECDITSTPVPTTEGTTRTSERTTTTPTVPDTTTTPVPTTKTTETPTEPTQETTTASGLCPNNEDEISYHPYPLDCAKFVECNEGKSRIFTCPGDFFWNDQIKSCDNPENVNCIISTTERTTPTTEPTTREPTTETTTKPITKTTTVTTESTARSTETPRTTTSSSLCPDQEPLSFHPYPGDCTRFVECSYGKGRVDKCPGGLYWNDVAKTCDFPYNVDCDM